MTFLLWAYPAGEASFKRILEHGGDPNVVYQKDFKYKTNNYELLPGDTLIFLAINSTRGSRNHYPQYKKPFENYMQLLIDHGADINFQRKFDERSPLHYAVFSQNREAIRQLIEAGADINSLDCSGQTPMMVMTHRFETILILLEAGADYRIVNKRNNMTIAHYLAYSQPHTKTDKENYDRLVLWLSERGISVENAGQQRKTWEARTNDGNIVSRVPRERIYRDDIPEGSQAPPPGPSTLTKERLDEYVNNAP